MEENEEIISKHEKMWDSSSGFPILSDLTIVPKEIILKENDIIVITKDNVPPKKKPHGGCQVNGRKVAKFLDR